MRGSERNKKQETQERRNEEITGRTNKKRRKNERRNEERSKGMSERMKDETKVL